MMLLLLTLLDGSTLCLDVPKNMPLDVLTKYGLMHIQAQDVFDCRLGVHVDDVAKWEKAAKDLGNKDFHIRDDATKLLRDNPREAYRFIMGLSGAEDFEVGRRVEQLLKLYVAIPPLDDVLVLRDGSVTGVLAGRSISGKSKSLGDVTVRLSQVVAISAQERKSVVRITKNDGWKKAGYVNGRLTVSATGEVDMWPQQGGQWMATPRGHTNGGTMHDGYPAGALLGRLNGKTFLIGDQFSSDNMGRGALEVSINGSPWSTTFTGEYLVKVE